MAYQDEIISAALSPSQGGCCSVWLQTRHPSASPLGILVWQPPATAQFHAVVIWSFLPSKTLSQKAVAMGSLCITYFLLLSLWKGGMILSLCCEVWSQTFSLVPLGTGQFVRELHTSLQKPLTQTPYGIFVTVLRGLDSHVPLELSIKCNKKYSFIHCVYIQ